MQFQQLILTLQRYWQERGCLLIQPYDVEKGAGTFNPATFLRSLGPEPFKAAYVEPCRRPTDGRYGDNPIRMQHYYQFQVILKPNPQDIVEQYLGSLRAIGVLPEEHDLRFVHDDWESPTLGAWGLGWEVWADGMEVTQFTYFQQVGGLELPAVCGEITYGLERLCMFLQGVDNVFDLDYNGVFRYGDLFHQNEVQGSRYNFELANVPLQRELFGHYEAECQRLCAAANPVTAVDYCLKASHTFNVLDARGAISVNERQNYILKVRTLARAVAEAWLQSREQLGYPLLARIETVPKKPLPVPPPRPPRLPDRAPLLIELGVEEMPARVFAPLLAQLPELFTKHFGPTRLDPQDVKFYLSPRRLVVSVGSLKTRQEDQRLEQKGPPLRLARDAQGNWTKAAASFAQKNGLAPAQLQTRTVGSEDYLYAERQVPGRPALDVLAEVIPAFFDAIHWYKTMRWGLQKAQFVRPVQWLVAKLGEAEVPCEYAGVTSGGASLGHRFLANRPVAVPADRQGYLTALRQHYVYADQDERLAMIRKQLEGSLAANGLTWVEDEELLAEVNYLVEYPIPVLCEFNETYLQIPEKVLITEMKEHQRYFACRQAGGGLSHHFLAISNMACRDMRLVAKGYAKVLRSRFDDAAFFLGEDTKVTLESRLPRLDQVTFHAKLGTTGAKIQRLRRLAADLAAKLELPAPAPARIDHLARLCKVDLTTSMVGEFPELQGEIGSYYAQQEGLDPVVAAGIREHYLPKSAKDELPTSVEAAVVGLADRLDSLVGLAAVTKLPSGSADPFGLRRACLTGMSLILAKGWHLDYRALIEAAYAGYGPVLKDAERPRVIAAQLEFALARLLGLLRDRGLARDSLDAAAKASTPWHDLVDFVARVEALEARRREPDFADVAATFKRCSNILEGEVAGAVDATLFRHDAERALDAAVTQAEKRLAACLAGRDYVAALAEIGNLRQAVDGLFDAVMVNDPDPALKLNRQRLVQRVIRQVLQLADFSAIQETNA